MTPISAGGSRGGALTTSYGAGLAGFETMPRLSASAYNVGLGPSGQVWWSFFTPSAPATITAFSTSSGDTAQTLATLGRIGLYTFDGTTLTLVARTGNATGNWNVAFASWTTNLDTAGGYPASYTVVPSQRYAVGLIMVTAGTMPTLYGVAPVHGNIMNRTPILVRSLAAQADLPASQALAATANNNRFFWVGGV